MPRLVNGLVGDLFREDAASLYGDLLAYSERELQTLDSEGDYIEQLAANALSSTRELFDDLGAAKLRGG